MSNRIEGFTRDENPLPNGGVRVSAIESPDRIAFAIDSDRRFCGIAVGSPETGYVPMLAFEGMPEPVEMPGVPPIHDREAARASVRQLNQAIGLDDAEVARILLTCMHALQAKMNGGAK